MIKIIVEKYIKSMPSYQLKPKIGIVCDFQFENRWKNPEKKYN